MSAALQTLASTGFRGAARAMQPADITAGARRIGCEEAMIAAIVDVESSGHGYDATGRPTMLPERHKFYQRLAATPDQQKAAVAAGMAYLRQGTLPYPSTPDACYQMLAHMQTFGAMAALESCSWGIGQVMGFNHAVDDYADAAEMVLACCDSEAAQFGLMLGYLEKNGLVKAMRNCDFRAIAVGYNGPAAAPAYAAKLAAAYLHHAAPRSAPSKLVAPALARPPLNPSQLTTGTWLGVRAGNTGTSADTSADDLNAAELARVRAGAAGGGADDLNAAELARIRGVS